jgi:putative transposase
MPQGLLRYHDSGQSHFLTFSCYQRNPKFADTMFYDLFPLCLEAMRLRFRMRIYGYVVMPEHVHLLVSEPEHGNLAEAMHYLKLSLSKRARSLRLVPQVRVPVLDPVPQVRVLRLDANLGPDEPFWQKRYYDRNVRSVREFGIKLRYLHRNPVKRGLVRDPGDWKWSSFRHYAFREMGVVEIESEWTGRDRELKVTGGQPRVFLCPS